MKLDSSISAIVTGGASGLGEATVRALRAYDVKVAIFDLNEKVGPVTAEKTGSLYCSVNVTDEASVDAGFAAARKANGQERILVNCAGTGVATKTAGRKKESGEITFHPLDQFNKIIQINLVGTFRCIAKSAAGMMTLDPLLDGDRGAIVNTASIAGVIADPGMSPYVAAKHGVIGLTKAAALDYATAGVRVNALAPGLVATGMTKGWLEDPEMRKVVVAGPQLGRPAEPEEIAGMVLYLTSDLASFATGGVYVVDGGQTAH
jgi:NAD(P)-dependent dehydrogenase (short-subunit alcohol dehydrogenase family)